MDAHIHDRRQTYNEITLAALRLVAGLMLVQHGVQKHFGWLLPPERPFTGAPEMFSRMWFAGTLEIFGGLMLAIGLLTRPVAFLLSGLMAFAFFIAHAPQGFWPILNGGELAALYCFVFLAYSAIGGGRYSVDALVGSAAPPAPRVREEGGARIVEPKEPTPFPNDRRKQKRRSRFRA